MAFCSGFRCFFIFNLVIVDNLFQEVFEDLVPWRGPGVSAQARDLWTLACRFESENRTLRNCRRLFPKWFRLWNSAARGWAGYCYHVAALFLDSSWSWKRCGFSANLWRANIVLFLFGFVRPMFLTFFSVLMRFDASIWSPFPFNKDTDFQFDFLSILFLRIFLRIWMCCLFSFPVID